MDLKLNMFDNTKVEGEALTFVCVDVASLCAFASCSEKTEHALTEGFVLPVKPCTM